MPSSIGHALAATAVGAVVLPTRMPRRVWLAGVVCAVLLDLDAIGRPFGRGDISWLGGHRALTHSIAFALVLGVVVSRAVRLTADDPVSRTRLAAFLVLATATHGVLDAFSEYGLGVQFLAPFSTKRFHAPRLTFAGPWQEILWIWGPAVMVMAAGFSWHRRPKSL